MANVEIRVQLGDVEVSARSSNTDRLGPSLDHGAPIDWGRIGESLPALIADAVYRVAQAAGAAPHEIANELTRRHAS